MGNAADGHLGDWLPHKKNCRCEDCALDRANERIKALVAETAALREALRQMYDLFEPTSPFYVQKICEQDQIDAIFSQARAALKETA